MTTLTFDGAVAQNYDIDKFLDARFAGISKDQEITLDFSKAPKEAKLKKHLPLILAKIKDQNVVKLDLSHAELSDLEADQVAKCIKTHPTIKTVVLSHNRIHDAGAQQLAKAMESNKNVDILLSNNSISTSGAVAYVKAAIESDKREIDLSGNKLGDLGAKNIALELAKKSNQVEMLILKHNGIGKLGDKHLAAAVPSHIRIFYRVEGGSILNSCPGMSNAVTRLFAAPIDYMLSSVLTPQEPEGTINPRTKE
ncbi:MAG: hypothetical protein JSR37_07825 [Verrucomicrobia bacterium]|nr:hypothetical protein [Verrucomicrobiota bacterium]